ncbi:MAG: hypothetical protein J5I50_08415 [Chitinophagaceae bacterium]|nr:hypothetical protein [Chitinophagaceae bacterium]
MKRIFIVWLLILSGISGYSQSVGINTDGSTPDPSSILDVKSTNKGFLMPRMTSAQRIAIANPAKGLQVFDTDTGTFWYYNGAIWVESVTGTGAGYWSLNGNNIFNNNTGYIGIGNTNPDYKLTIFSNVIEANDNTQLLSLRGQNPILSFADQNNVPFGYIKSWTHSPYAPFTNGMVIGASPGYPIFLSTNNYSATMTIADNGNVGIGTTLPDAKLSLSSNVVAANNNTNLLSLHGRNPIINFWDENNIGYGYIKSWTSGASAPYTNGMVIGAAPGYPIFLSTNNYSATMTIADNGNVGIGTTLPDAKLTLTSNVVAANNNTNLLSLHGRNPILSFWDENNIGYGYIKSWTSGAPAPYKNGMVIGSAPGYPIMFSTNGYSLSMMIADNGNVGIGTGNPTYKLSVNGNVRSKEVVVESNWADYVFENDYKLLSLNEVEQFIKQNNHLPGIPTAKEVQKNGLSVGDIQSKMMEKIEELTLYVIELQKQIDQLKNGRNEK